MTERPRVSSRPATHGLAVSAGRLARNVAPAKAPTKPGTARVDTIFQSTLPSLWWENPETSEVPISETCTAADAAAGATPVASSSVEDVTPKVITKETTTSWVKRQTHPRTMKLSMFLTCFLIDST